MDSVCDSIQDVDEEEPLQIRNFLEGQWCNKWVSIVSSAGLHLHLC